MMLVVLFVGCAAPSSKNMPHDAQRAAPAQDWREVPLPGKRRTRYTAMRDEGRPVVLAVAEASASAYRRRVRIAPGRVDKARFSWRVESLMHGADLRDRDAADSPVRVMFAFDGDHARLSPHDRAMFDLAHALTGERPPYATLMYVWDNHAPVESVIPGGRSSRIRKLVLESGGTNVGRWRYYERDIAADFRRAFGEEPGALVSIGLMTDSDNTRSSARAWYGDVHLCGVPELRC